MKIRRQPNFYRPSSQLVTRRQLNQAPARRWTEAMHVPLSITRKTWERAYILQVLRSRGILRPGVRGLGFGVGADPMIPVMVNYGCQLVATDYGDSDRPGWGAALELNPRGVASAEAMELQVRFRDVNMNEIPDDLTGFDFVYSCGSLEHIGGLQNGLDFIESAMSCLRPGGVAVHTTELNISDTNTTMDSPGLSLYLPEQIDGLIRRLNDAGHDAPPVNYRKGTRSADSHVAVRPFAPPCLNWKLGGYKVTSLGLVIQASKQSTWPVGRAGFTVIGDVAIDAYRALARRATGVFDRR